MRKRSISMDVFDFLVHTVTVIKIADGPITDDGLVRLMELILRGAQFQNYYLRRFVHSRLLKVLFLLERKVAVLERFHCT